MRGHQRIANWATRGARAVGGPERVEADESERISVRKSLSWGEGEEPLRNRSEYSSVLEPGQGPGPIPQRMVLKASYRSRRVMFALG